MTARATMIARARHADRPTARDARRLEAAGQWAAAASCWNTLRLRSGARWWGWYVEQGERCARTAVTTWNERHPEGTPVRFWTGLREGAGREGLTRCSAWLSPSGNPVVLITGQAGYVALTHVDPHPPGAPASPSAAPQGEAQP